jgi:hypothetical protein
LIDGLYEPSAAECVKNVSKVFAIVCADVYKTDIFAGLRDGSYLSGNFCLGKCGGNFGMANLIAKSFAIHAQQITSYSCSYLSPSYQDLNLRIVDDEKVTSYLWREPFATLVRLLKSNLIGAAGLARFALFRCGVLEASFCARPRFTTQLSLVRRPPA